VQQEQPPDADEGAGGDEAADGASRVGGGQFTAERVGDGLRCAELGDRRRRGSLGR
jgi:hypothetical protein